jgi:hypothetical protein
MKLNNNKLNLVSLLRESLKNHFFVHILNLRFRELFSELLELLFFHFLNLRFRELFRELLELLLEVD